MNQPLDKIKWVDRSTLKPNNYNPNNVAPAELELLKISILEDGWTQPIVINPDDTIVDGFHRWIVSGEPEVLEMTKGKVPVVVMNPKDENHQMMSTIRHNRARGTHAILKMSDIVLKMKNDGLTASEIMERLQMEDEEVIRLLHEVGIPLQMDDQDEFNNAWVPTTDGTRYET